VVPVMICLVTAEAQRLTLLYAVVTEAPLLLNVEEVEVPPIEVVYGNRGSATAAGELILVHALITTTTLVPLIGNQTVVPFSS